MLGAIIGDIAGSRWEFSPTHDYAFELFSESNDFTDDTICTVAVAEALLHGRDYGENIHKWCRRYPHPMGGYGGALKQLSIGVASSYGKAYIHGAGVPENLWTPDHDSFLESMADAASSVVNYFHGNMIFINVMKNMSVDCDCCEIAEDPCMADMGILVSTDPIAIDQACIDLVYGCDDPGKAHFLERVESRNGVHTIEAAAALGFGSREYTLVKVD